MRSLEPSPAARIAPERDPLPIGALLADGCPGVRSYRWGSKGEPDPSGEIFAAMRGFLSSDHGKHIQALFWDFASLYQNLPPRLVRDEAQNEHFKAALEVMGDVCERHRGSNSGRQRAPCALLV